MIIDNKFPDGNFLGWEIWKRDPSPKWVKSFWIVATVFSLIYMFFSTHIIIDLMGMDGCWDEQHNLGTPADGLFSWMALDRLASVTLHLPISSVRRIFVASYGAYGSLVVADILLGGNAVTIELPTVKSFTHPWPPSWLTENTMCYSEMFAEPSSLGRLLRRPGNTLSNVNYLLSSLCVMASILYGNQVTFYWIADLTFATMLLILAVTSTLWHASNAPWSQYPDIWSMECCTFYLIVRYSFVAGQKGLIRFLGVDPKLCGDLTGKSCWMVYAFIIHSLGKHYWNLYNIKWLHNGCPFSGRARLLGMSDIRGRRHQICNVSTVCAFAILPVVYTGLPTILQVVLIGSVGSRTAANWVFRTLVIGWTYRLCERWVLDGCPFNFLSSWNVDLPRRTTTISSSIFSPTASFHFLTGLTLLTGYIHCRSVEEI